MNDHRRSVECCNESGAIWVTVLWNQFIGGKITVSSFQTTIQLFPYRLTLLPKMTQNLDNVSETTWNIHSVANQEIYAI